MLVDEKDLNINILNIACYRLHDACGSGKILGKTKIL